MATIQVDSDERGPVLEWFSGDPPKDRRILLIGTPLEMPEADQKPDIVLGHWHEGNWGYVAVRPPYDENARPRPSLKVLRWAEIPSIPEDIELRPLSDSDLQG